VRLGASWASLTLVTLLVCGCGSTRAAAVRKPSPTPLPTLQSGFKIEVTPVSVKRTNPPKSHRRPTPFIPPKGPYLALFPKSGPPLSRTILVRGGGLPRSAPIQLSWGPPRRALGLTRTVYSNGKGNFSASFSIPGSPPGFYQITAQVNGVSYASSRYSVISAAVLSVRVSARRKGERVVVRGRRFLPKLRLVLIAYPMVAGGKVQVFGSLKTAKNGSFKFLMVTRKLQPGQYLLEALSQSALSTQMSQTFFQVVV
jgi:hypothetical protein